MPRQMQAVEVNKFTAGLFTDANPLTTPDNSSLEEENFILHTDGSRSRRLGLDFETSFTEVTTTISNGDSIEIANSSYKWRNAGGDPDKSILVIQFGNEIKFFDLSTSPISDNLIDTHVFTSATQVDVFSYANVDGILVITTGEKTPYIFQIDDVNNITVTTQVLKIRDLLGVEDIYQGTDLFDGSGLQVRPAAADGISQPHRYNLRNQTWGVPRPRDDDPGLPFDTIRSFVLQANKSPSNSDTVTQALYADPNISQNRTLERFWPRDVSRNPIGSTQAPSGYFIIDALERGASRVEEDEKNRDIYTELFFYPVTDLPEDRTPGGPSVVTEYAGRAWYAGFSGEVIDGDKRSPKMSSYVLFSKLVRNVSDITQCYQEGDPTSKDAPDIIDTDGGFIRINEAYGIRALINLGSSLMVVASNGVWRITGGTDNGFTATTYIVEKITDRGCINQQSVVVIDTSFMFWGDDGIYHVTTDQFGAYVSNNITFGRIQTLYDEIDTVEKRSSKAAYDSYERKVRWLYNVRVNDAQETRELILDISLNAWSLNSVKQIAGGKFPRVVNYFIGNAYVVDTSEIPVVVGADPVMIGVEAVTVNIDSFTSIFRREVFYVVMTDTSPTISYSFALYSDLDFLDWFSYDQIGVDANAFLVTSYLSGGDFQRDKQVPYLTIHLRRTETGFDTNLVALNQSSCLVQVRWEWSDSDRSNKWSREFQAYRYRRFYLPIDSDDDYDNGFSTISSRNKIRGNGRALSIKFRTEPRKNLHLYGWSMILSMADSL